MHYFPHLVLPLDKAGDGKAKSSKLDGILNKTAWIPRQWNKVSEDTGVGNPKKATAQKGEKYLDDVTTRIGDFFVEIAKCDLDDLYE